MLERARFATKADSTTLESPGPPIRRTDPRRTPRIPSPRSPPFALAAVLATPSAAQEPSGRRRPPSGGGTAGPQYHELLPDIGLIGAQVGIAGGASWNPFEVGQRDPGRGVRRPAAGAPRARQALLRDPGRPQPRPQRAVRHHRPDRLCRQPRDGRQPRGRAGRAARGAVPRAPGGPHAAAPDAGVAFRAQVHAAPTGQRAAAAVRRSRPRLRGHHHPPGPGGRREPRVHGHRSLRRAADRRHRGPGAGAGRASATRRARGTSISGSTSAAAWRSGSRGACR